MSPEAPREADFSPPFRYPFLLGAMLATNAIPDARLLVDGPPCTFRTAQLVHGKHDWASDLLDASGRHRILSTDLSAEGVVRHDGEAVARHIRAIARQGGAGAVFVGAMPHVAVLAPPYEELLGALRETVPLPLLELGRASLDEDWLDGYQAALEALAAGLPLPRGETRPERVAVVGYLMDRTEADHTLAARTGARVLSCDPPFGLESTVRFLRAVAQATGRAEAAERVITDELRAVVPRLEWAVPHVFTGRRLAFSATPSTTARTSAFAPGPASSTAWPPASTPHAEPAAGFSASAARIGLPPRPRACDEPGRKR